MKKPEIIPTYKIICLIAECFSKMNMLILSTLYNIDNKKKKATNAFPKTNGFPKVRIFKYVSGKFIPINTKKEYAKNIAYNPKNFFSPKYDFGGSSPSK